MSERPEMENLVWAIAFMSEYFLYARGTVSAENRAAMLRGCAACGDNARAAYKEFDRLGGVQWRIFGAGVWVGAQRYDTAEAAIRSAEAVAGEVLDWKRGGEGSWHSEKTGLSVGRAP